MTLPPKKKPHKGRSKVPRHFPRHERFVRSHQCVVKGCEQGPIVFAHVRSSKHGGMGLKPGDWFGVSLCDAHHEEQHSSLMGERRFEQKYNLDLLALAREFAAKTDDKDLRLYLSESCDGQ